MGRSVLAGARHNPVAALLVSFALVGSPFGDARGEHDPPTEVVVKVSPALVRVVTVRPRRYEEAKSNPEAKVATVARREGA